MTYILDHPIRVFVISLVVLSISGYAGTYLAGKRQPFKDGDRGDIDLIIGSSLTLLALIIGFSFGMAVSRYDARKDYEEEEANAIGTEYARMDLLPVATAANGRQLLKQFLHQRVLFYELRDPQQLDSVQVETAKLESQMWFTVQSAATAQPTATVALAVAGMNDVINREGYTLAAWLNRIPEGAWILMFGLALCCTLLIGYGARRRGVLMLWVMPFLLSISFFLIADIDSPRHGVIRVAPENLIELAQSLQGR